MGGGDYFVIYFAILFAVDRVEHSIYHFIAYDGL